MNNKCIDWYEINMQETKEAVPQVFIETDKENYIYWEDIITKTKYGISKEQYNTIYTNGCNVIEQFFHDKNLEKIEEIFYNPEIYGREIALFACLPKQIGTSDHFVRICDYVCLRTAFLYIIKYEQIKESSDFEAEKNRLRMQGFTWNFVGKMNRDSQMEWIDNLLLGTIGDISLTDYDCEADVVKGGAVKIKQYYLETNKIPEIRGASNLLNVLNMEKMPECIYAEHIRECLIYAGGGKVLGIFPKGCGDEMSRKLERVTEEVTVTAQSNFCSVTVQLSDFAKNYQKMTEKLDLLLEERQGLRWDFQVEPQRRKEDIDKKRRDEYDILCEGDRTICDSCKQRHATVQLLKEPKSKQCWSCLYKNLFGGRMAKRSNVQKYEEYIQKQNDITVDLEEEDEFHTLEDIGKMSNGFIGVIYGDANSMSKAIGEISSPMEMRYFSEITENTITNIVFDALYQHLGTIPAFEIIAVGGDDIFVIVPGNKTYDIACTIGKQFDRHFRSQSADENSDIGKLQNMTMSIGVCITHYHLPVLYSFGIVQQLLKSAKQKAWEMRQNGEVTGTIDWMVMENDISGGTVLRYQRRDIDQKPHKTLRPYTFHEADAMKKFKNFLEQIGKKSFAFQMRQSFYQHTKQESELFYEYQIQKETDPKKQINLIDLGKSFGGEAVKNNIKIGEEVYTPWIDVIELWDYIGEQGDEES